MELKITPKFNNSFNVSPSVKAKKQQEEQQLKLGEDNPISQKGEAMNLIKTTFLGGLGVGGYLLLELIEDGEFVLDSMFQYSDKLSKASTKKEQNKIKNEIETAKKAAKDTKILKTLGIFATLIAAVISGFALLYTAFHAPKIAYESKVNAFQKSKEMDVYIKANEAEKELYEQLDNKAKDSTPEEKEKLKTQYMQMKNAKNQVPDFVKL